MGLRNNQLKLSYGADVLGQVTERFIIKSSHRYPSQSTIASATLLECVHAEENRVLSKHGAIQ